MAKGNKHKPIRKKNGLARFNDYIRKSLYLTAEEERDQAELSRSAREHLHEVTGEVNTKAFNANFRTRVQGKIPAYQPDKNFNYSANQSTFFVANPTIAFNPADPNHINAPRTALPLDFTIYGFGSSAFHGADPKEHNIAEYFLSGYAGNPFRISRIDPNPLNTPQQPYGSTQSPEMLAMREKLAQKIYDFDVALQTNIAKGVSGEWILAAKTGFLEDYDLFVADCKAQIKNRGINSVSDSSPRSVIEILEDAANLRQFDAGIDSQLTLFRDCLASHFTRKIAQTQTLAPAFQLWDPENVTFSRNDGNNRALTVDEINTLNRDLDTIRTYHTNSLKPLLTSLDNDPALVLAIKKLDTDTQEDIQAILADLAKLNIQVTIGQSSLIDYIHQRLPTITQAAVDLRAAMNAEFKTPKSRLQQWRFDYDQTHSAAHDKALNDPHKLFTDAAKTAAAEIATLTPQNSRTEAFTVHINTKGATVPFEEPEVTLLDTLLAEYQAFANNSEVVPKPAALSTAPTAEEIAAHTAYEAYRGGPIPSERLATIAQLQKRSGVLRTELRNTLFNSRVSPIVPVKLRVEEEEEEAAFEARQAKYVQEKALHDKQCELYTEYTQAFAPANNKPTPIDPATANANDKEAYATRLEAYTKELTAYQTRQSDLETELTQLNAQSDQVALKEYQAVKANYDKLTSICAFYQPEDTTTPDGPSFAQFSQQYQTLSDRLVALQIEYKDALRKLLDIEFRFQPEQAHIDLDELKANCEKKYKVTVAELTQLNQTIQQFQTTDSDAAVNKKIAANKALFATQIDSLVTAQQTAFTAIVAAANKERDAAIQDCTDYQLRYEVYCMQHGPLIGPLTKDELQEIADYRPEQLIRDLRDDPIFGDKLDLGLVSITANKTDGQNHYRIHLAEPAQLDALKNRSDDGSIKLCAYLRHMFSKESRSTEIRAALHNPEKINDVGKAVLLILAAASKSNDANGRPIPAKNYISTYPAYNDNNLNTMLATSMACISLGVNFDPAADFDRSFKGAVYKTHSGGQKITGELKGPAREKARKKYLTDIQVLRAKFAAHQATNNVCRELLIGGLKPGKVPDELFNTSERNNLSRSAHDFVSSLAHFSYHDTTTAGQLASVAQGGDKSPVLMNSVERLKKLNLSQVKCLSPDGGGNCGQSAALFGMVLDRRSAAEILALKEREICALYRELDPNIYHGYHVEVNKLREQLNQDYLHITHLAEAQGLYAPEFKEQHAAAMARIDKIANTVTVVAADTPSRLTRAKAFLFGKAPTPSYGDDIPNVETKRTVDDLRATGYAAEVQLNAFDWTPGTSEQATSKLVELAALHRDILPSRDVGQADTALDTPFVKAALENIEKSATDLLLEIKSIPVIAELNAALATLETTKPEATNQPATADYQAKKTLLEAKKTAIENVTQLLLIAKESIGATRDQIASKTIEVNEALALSPNDLETKIRRLQELDAELTAIAAILPTHKNELNALVNDLILTRKGIISFLTDDSLLETFANLSLEQQQAKLQIAIKGLKTALIDPNSRSNNDETSSIETHIRKLGSVKQLVHKVSTAIAIEVPDPSALELEAYEHFYSNATTKLRALTASEQAVSASTDIAPTHKNQLLSAIATEKAALIARAETVSVAYAVNLPSNATLTAAETFRDEAGLHSVLIANPGLDAHLCAARKQLAATQAIITTTATLYQQRLAVPTTYKEAVQQRQKLNASLTALYAIINEEARRSPEQQQEITNLIAMLHTKLSSVVDWISDEVTVYRATLAAIINTGNEKVAASVDSIGFYTAVTDEMIELNQFITVVNNSTTISPEKKANLNEQIQNRKEVLIGRAFDQSATYADTLPSNEELTAARTFVATAGLTSNLIYRHDLVQGLDAAAGTMRITDLKITTALRTRVQSTGANSFEQLSAELNKLTQLRDELITLNQPQTASPKQKILIPIIQDNLAKQKTTIIEIAQQKASTIIGNPKATDAELQQAHTFFTSHAPNTLKSVSSGPVARALGQVGAIKITEECENILAARNDKRRSNNDIELNNISPMRRG